MNDIDPHKIADIIRGVAADKIEPRFRKLAEEEIQEKTSATDLVTVADIEAEEELTRIFKEIDPGCVVLGEEAVSQETISMDVLRTPVPERTWVIDPVDGTHNFATGKPIFGTMVSCIQNGTVVAAWIFDVPGNRLVMGQKGAGVQLEGTPITFPKQDKLPLDHIDGFMSRKFLPSHLKPGVDKRLEDIRSVDAYFCAAHEYLDILTQKRHFSIYTKLMPWDHLAGSFLVKEAGGDSRKWDGSAYVPGETEGGLITTHLPAIWADVQGHIVEPFRDQWPDRWKKSS